MTSVPRGVRALRTRVGRIARRTGLRPVRPVFHRPEPMLSPSLARVVALGRATVGKETYGFPTVRIFDEETNLHIGAHCSIADDVMILLGGGHRPDWVTTSPLRILAGLPGGGHDGHPRRVGDVVIGSDVWIAERATVLSGTRIGHGAVVGAGAVVGGEVPPFAIVAGNRAEVVRYRFNEEQREALLRIAWWDWPLADVVARVDELCSPDIDAFIAKFDR
jgi:acetyltransferase-like isoleucine patch superfamily enzyme